MYDVDENYSYPRIKIGDGENYVSNLPFIDEQGNFCIEVTQISDEAFGSSKTYDEFVEAFTKGKFIYAVMGGLVFTLNMYDLEYSTFNSIITNNEDVVLDTLIFQKSTNTFTIKEIPILQLAENLYQEGRAADAAMVGAAFDEVNEKLAKKVEAELVGTTLKLFNVL